MQPFKNDPTKPSETVSGDNMVGTPTNVTINGIDAHYWQINGEHPSGTIITGIIPVTFAQRTNAGAQGLAPGQPIAGAAVQFALNSWKFPSQSTPGVELAWPGMTPGAAELNLVSDAEGNAAFEISVGGPKGGVAIFTYTLGNMGPDGKVSGNTYEDTITIQ